MKTSREKKNSNTNCLTIGDVIYKTAGNILFSDGEEDPYFLAESPVLEKMEKAIQVGILENGMQTFLRKISAAE